jgi:hypothetical protein
MHQAVPTNNNKDESHNAEDESDNNDTLEDICYRVW